MIIRDFIFYSIDERFLLHLRRDLIMTTFTLLFSHNLPSMKIIVVRRGVSHSVLPSEG